MKTKFDLNNIRVTVTEMSIIIDVTTRTTGDFDRKWLALKKQGVKTKRNLYGGSYLFSAQEYLSAEKLCREHEYVGEWPGNLEILEAQKRALIDDLDWLKSHNKNDRHNEEIGELSVELDRVNTDLDKLNKTLDSHSTDDNTVKKINKSELFKTAWEMAKTAVKNFGGKIREYFGEALREAWKQMKNTEQNIFDIIEKLTTAGGREWQKGDHHRVYFNELADKYLDTTNMRNWQRRQLNRASIYFDVNTRNWWRGDTVEDDHFSTIMAKIGM